MKKIECGIVAGITMLSFSLSCITPTFAVCNESDPNCVVNEGSVITTGSEDEAASLQTSDVVIGLSSVTVNPTEVSVALGEEKEVVVSYNSGFETTNLDDTGTNVEFTSGDDEYVAYVGFNGQYDGETYQTDYNSIYVYGNEIGTSVYTVTTTDVNGNTATATINVTTREALSYAYDAITFVSDEGWTEASFEAGVDFDTPVEGGRNIKLTEVPMTDDLQALDENMKAVLDIVVVDKDGTIIPVDSNSIKMWFGVNKAELAEGEQYFQIAYIKDGKIVEFIDVDNVEDDGWGFMFDFHTTHCSAYAILASDTPFESAESRNAKLPQDDSGIGAPNTGAFTKGSETSVVSDSGLIATFTVLSLILAVHEALKYAKR